jgi:lysophospholipid acyltransferase (LPLAT)-like uncharacterized protein
LGSWDRFEIPKPFARITVLYDAPLSVGDGSLRALAAQTDAFGAHMQQAMDRVQRLAEARR